MGQLVICYVNVLSGCFVLVLVLGVVLVMGLDNCYDFGGGMEWVWFVIVCLVVWSGWCIDW